MDGADVNAFFVHIPQRAEVTQFTDVQANGGNGEVDFDSNVHMTFRSIMGDSETQLPVMKRVLGGASGQFMLIHVDGTISNPEMTSEAFPTLSAALQNLQSQRRNPDGLRSAAALRRDAQGERLR